MVSQVIWSLCQKLKKELFSDAALLVQEPFVRVDISFEAPGHRGMQTVALVRRLSTQFPALVPLVIVLKQFLHEQSLDRVYTGGLSSYCLVLLVARFLQTALSGNAAAVAATNVVAESGADQELCGNLDHPAAGAQGSKVKEISGSDHAAGLNSSVTSSPTATLQKSQVSASKTMLPGVGRLLLDCLHFYGVVFDPRRTLVRIAIPSKPIVESSAIVGHASLGRSSASNAGHGAATAVPANPARRSGVINSLDPLLGLDPLCIQDPLSPNENNVGVCHCACEKKQQHTRVPLEGVPFKSVRDLRRARSFQDLSSAGCTLQSWSSS
eukprot:SAG31_NODE_708_length_12684_cov_8.500199_2_plen_325_part_00